MSAPTNTVQEILDRSRSVYLNDPDAKVWSNTKLLPFLKSAYDDYQTELANNDLSTIDEVAPPLIITAGTTVYSPLPTDFVWPVKLEERLSGSDDLYTLMRQLRWTNNVRRTPDTRLDFYNYIGDAINFPEASVDVEVLLYYKKLYPLFPDQSGEPIVDKTTNVRGHAMAAISAKVAELIHRFVNQNTTLADLCEAQSKGEAFKVVNLYIKAAQAIPARPRPYRSYFRLGGYWGR